MSSVDRYPGRFHESVGQWLWNRVLDWSGRDGFRLFVIGRWGGGGGFARYLITSTDAGTNAMTIAVYWSVGLFYLMLDATQSLRKYKVQPGTHEPIEWCRLGPVSQVPVRLVGLISFQLRIANDSLSKLLLPTSLHYGSMRDTSKGNL